MAIPWLGFAMDEASGGKGSQDRSAKNTSPSTSTADIGGQDFGWYSPFIVGGTGNTASADSLPDMGSRSSSLAMIALGGLAIWVFFKLKK